MMQPQYAVPRAVVASGASPVRRRPSVRWQFTAAALLVVGAVLLLLSTAVLPWVEAGVVVPRSLNFISFADRDPGNRTGLWGAFLSGSWIFSAVVAGLFAVVCWGYADPARRVAMVFVPIAVLGTIGGGWIGEFASGDPTPIGRALPGMAVLVLLGALMVFLIRKGWIAWSAWLVVIAAGWGLAGSLAVVIQNATQGAYTFLAWAWLMPLAYAMLLAGGSAVIVARNRMSRPSRERA